MEVRDELKADNRRLEAKFNGLEVKFGALESKMDSKFAAMGARLALQESKFDARFEELLVSAHRTQAIVEEQRSENRIMLEALNGFVHRMDRMEKRLDDHDAVLRSLARR